MGLTEKQKKFIKICKDNDLKVYYDYSGRGMFGETCPAVDVDNLSDFPENPHEFKIDNMGLGYVIYAQF